MSVFEDRRLPLAAAVGFAVPVVAGNLLQGSTPAPHSDAAAVVDFYSSQPTLVAVAMMLSLLAVFSLAAFLAVLHRELDATASTWCGRMAAVGGPAIVALLAGGFALNSAGALRAGSAEGIAAEAAVVFYDGSLALTGLGATLAMAVVLAPIALLVLRSGRLPRWLGWSSAVLAGLGLVTPVSFVLFLLFPVWVLAMGVALSGQRLPVASGADPR